MSTISTTRWRPVMWTRLVEWCKRVWQARQQRHKRWEVAQFVLKSMRDPALSEEARRAITELALFGSWVESRFAGKVVDGAGATYEGYVVSSSKSATEIVHINLWIDFRRAAVKAHAESVWELGSRYENLCSTSTLFGLHVRLTKLPDLEGRPDFSIADIGMC